MAGADPTTAWRERTQGPHGGSGPKDRTDTAANYRIFVVCLLFSAASFLWGRLAAVSCFFEECGGQIGRKAAGCCVPLRFIFSSLLFEVV